MEEALWGGGTKPSGEQGSSGTQSLESSDIAPKRAIEKKTQVAPPPGLLNSPLPGDGGGPPRGEEQEGRAGLAPQVNRVEKEEKTVSLT